VAFVSDVYPECPDEACNARRADEAEKNPVKVHHVKRLLFRHWSDWREELRHHVFVTEIATGRTIDVTPGDFDSPPFFNEDHGIAFSPDGTQIAFVSNREGGDAEAWTTNHDVWVVPVTGGTPRNLTASNKAADMQPTWSPDGRRVFMRSQRRPGFESDRWYLDAVAVENGQRHNFVTPAALSIENFLFTRDGKTLLFTAQDRGLINLYAVDAATGVSRVGPPGGGVTPVARGGAIGAFDAGQDFAIVARSAINQPPDLFRVAVSGGEPKQLTRENEKWLNDVTFSTPESLTVTGANSAEVQYWLIKPPHFDASKKYPVVFLIHGGPQGAWQDAWSTRWNPALWAAQGWVVAAPNPRGSTGFG
jgi:dipeptidyl aminopeptidase/acylaminoacyl peptidase